MNVVKSAKRVLDILRFFAEEKRPASLARLCSAMGLPKSSGLALMETLVAEGYAYQTGGQYYLTGRWLREAEVVATHDPIVARCRPTLQRLSQQVGETVILAQLAHSQVVYLDVIEADHVLKFSATPGQRKPIHAAASGRALLSVLPKDQVRRMIESLDYQKLTPHTLTSPSALMKAVEQGRTRGWHVNVGEHQADTISIAVPVVLDGNPLALVVGAPSSRLKSRLDEMGATLLRAATTLMSVGKH